MKQPLAHAHNFFPQVWEMGVGNGGSGKWGSVCKNRHFQFLAGRRRRSSSCIDKGIELFGQPSAMRRRS
ncbi:MAG: hypothetical protein ACR2OZ_05640, partial [Verrucomicrobiales bacterium]